MGNKIYILIAIILFICLTGVVIYTYFEIYPKQKTIYPSSEVENNSFLAAERWLKATGHNIRITDDFSLLNITEAHERVVIIDYWMFDPEEAESIIEWIKQGHFLIIFEDISKLNTESFDNINKHGLIIKEELKGINLAEIKIGKGIINLVSTPRFMYNRYLLDEDNARLTWKLTGGRTDETNMDILFIRRPNINESKSIFGAIMERGNFTPVIISALLLIFIGFWAVVPCFGLVTNDKQKNSRPINERFTAEIRFLKKYKALDYYLDKKEKSDYSYNELINQYRRKLNGNTKN